MAEVNLTELVEKIRPAVATIIIYDMDKKVLAQGSGFFVNNKGHLITNYHVLEGAYNAEVKTYDGNKYSIKSVVAENKTADLIKVLVDIPDKSRHWVRVTKALPAVAERVLVVGSPMGLEQTVSEGIVSAVRELPTVGKFFQISAPISPGSSGSPVVNMKGEVIGVATFQLVKGQNLNFAVPGKYVLDLKQETPGKTILEWTYGIIKKKSEEADKWFRKGTAYAELDLHREAINAYKQAIRIDPNHAGAYNNLGIEYAELGFHRNAIENYKQAILIDNNNAGTYQNLGYSYGQLDLHREAINAYKQAIRIDPTYATAYYNLSSNYTKLGRYRDAIEALKQAIRIDPYDASAHYGLGIAYLGISNKTAALEQYEILKGLDRDLADQLGNYIYR